MQDTQALMLQQSNGDHEPGLAGSRLNDEGCLKGSKLHQPNLNPDMIV